VVLSSLSSVFCSVVMSMVSVVVSDVSDVAIVAIVLVVVIGVGVVVATVVLLVFPLPLLNILTQRWRYSLNTNLLLQHLFPRQLPTIEKVVKKPSCWHLILSMW